jgi:hypothetical protein
MRPVMMTEGSRARARGVNRSDKAKERNREQDGFCHNDFRLFFGINWRAALGEGACYSAIGFPAIAKTVTQHPRPHWNSSWTLERELDSLLSSNPTFVCLFLNEVNGEKHHRQLHHRPQRLAASVQLSDEDKPALGAERAIGSIAL